MRTKKSLCVRARVTQERLKELFDYDPIYGTFYRKSSGGLPAGNVRKDGYCVVHIDGVLYYTHRLVFLWENGTFPKEEVDFKDGDVYNKSRSNLKEATRTQNVRNSKVSRSNTTSVKGVYPLKKGFVSTMTVGGTLYYLGYYKELIDAARARFNKEKEVPGYLSDIVDSSAKRYLEAHSR